MLVVSGGVVLSLSLLLNTGVWDGIEAWHLGDVVDLLVSYWCTIK